MNSLTKYPLSNELRNFLETASSKHRIFDNTRSYTFHTIMLVSTSKIGELICTLSFDFNDKKYKIDYISNSNQLYVLYTLPKFMLLKQESVNVKNTNRINDLRECDPNIPDHYPSYDFLRNSLWMDEIFFFEKFLKNKGFILPS